MLHHTQIDGCLDRKLVEHLLKDLFVLAACYHEGFNIGAAVEFQNHRRHLDSVGSGAADSENSEWHGGRQSLLHTKETCQDWRMKALILAGGTGSRLRPITHSIAKQLVPVANKAVIEYGIEAIRETGVTDFGIIVGDSRKEIEEHLGDGSRWSASFQFIQQEAPLGLAHAVKTARDYLGSDRFIMYLGDNLIRGGVKELVDQFEHSQFDASILLTKVPNPEQFGVAELEGESVVRLQEKPAKPKSDLALVGVYLFTPLIFEAIETLKPSNRGEYEITDAIQTLIDWQRDVRYQIVTGWWKDTGTVEAMLEANRLILDSLDHASCGSFLDSQIDECVSIAEGAEIQRSKVVGPCIIGARCKIIDSEIGPYAAIGEGSTIVGSRLLNSIVMSGSRIERVPAPISGSLIGRGVTFKGAEKTEGFASLVLGDNSSVILP